MASQGHHVNDEGPQEVAGRVSGSEGVASIYSRGLLKLSSFGTLSLTGHAADREK